jgi:hypothetical protein
MISFKDLEIPMIEIAKPEEFSSFFEIMQSFSF